jgi:hypothetical protein
LGGRRTGIINGRRPRRRSLPPTPPDARLAVCLTSHDRVECARISQEIFRLNFAGDYRIVHASSGARAAPYLEDELVRCAPMPLHAGAINLLQRTLEAAARGPRVDFLLHLEADTWMLDEGAIARIIARMQADPRLLLATSAWSNVAETRLAQAARELRRATRDLSRIGATLRSIPSRVAAGIEDFSTQCFVIRNDPRVLDCVLGMRPDPAVHAERALFDAYLARFPMDTVLRMTEREPVHPTYRYACAPLGLHCEHWPAAGTSDDPRPPADPLHVPRAAPGKKEALLARPALRRGETLNRLLESTEYDWYNPGARRH